LIRTQNAFEERKKEQTKLTEEAEKKLFEKKKNN